MENKFCTFYIHEVCDFKTVGESKKEDTKESPRSWILMGTSEHPAWA